MRHIVIPATDWRESSAMEGNFNICRGMRVWRVTPVSEGLKTTLQTGLDKAVQIPIQNRLRITGFRAGSQVLDSRLI